MGKGKKSTFKARPGARKGPQPGKTDRLATTARLKQNLPVGES